MATFPPIVLLTDFGMRDAYAGSMKGVILNLFPQARIVDLTHEIEPQNVRQASFVLESAYRFFPKGSIFVSVVDPGVGSERRILAAKTPYGIFLAPDNGLLTRVLAREKPFILRTVTNREFFLKNVSYTFHGRDCFSPTAARLAKKPALFAKLGSQVKDFSRFSFAPAEAGRESVKGEIFYFDHFGNGFTNITREHLGPKDRKSLKVRVKGKLIKGIRQSYYEAPKGEPVAVFSSGGLLEIAVNQGSARKQLKLEEGAIVEVS